MPPEQRQCIYWRRNLRVTGLLLLLWFLVTFVVTYFARELADFTVLGLPFGFFMAAQGAPLIYALYMNRLDRTYGVREAADSELERHR
ncbi:MAG TPA: DUF4212 domain-containing protein [Accumulibacter sp.]|nr:DUF4212 domain-containing protein [Accumulibacter sp.]